MARSIAARPHLSFSTFLSTSLSETMIIARRGESAIRTDVSWHGAIMAQNNEDAITTSLLGFQKLFFVEEKMKF